MRMEVSALKLYLKTKTGADATGEYDSASKVLTVMNKLLPAVFRFDGYRFYCLRAKP